MPDWRRSDNHISTRDAGSGPPKLSSAVVELLESRRVRRATLESATGLRVQSGSIVVVRDSQVGRRGGLCRETKRRARYMRNTAVRSAPSMPLAPWPLFSHLRSCAHDPASHLARSDREPTHCVPKAKTISHLIQSPPRQKHSVSPDTNAFV